MSYVNDYASTQSGLAGRISAYVTRFKEHRARRRVYATTLRELMELSDRDLNDLGLHRSEIRRVAWQAANGM